MAVHFCLHANEMAAQRKRISPATGSEVSKKAKRQVCISTFEKWQREHQSILWLQCDEDVTSRSLVATLYCGVCRRFEDRITGMHNFSPAWLTGTTSHQTSNVLDHAKSEQHIACMGRLQEERARAQDTPTTSYALHSCCMDYLFM